MTLAQKLDLAITSQQAEVTRLETQALVDLDTARQRLARLQQMRTLVTPDLEAAYIETRQLGIRLDD